MTRRRLTQSKLEKAVAAVAAACGATPQVEILPDGTIRITPVDAKKGKSLAVDRPKPISL